jgi:hypothetical protein
MCAIAGLYAFAPSAPPADRAELRTIRDHMAARGPTAMANGSPVMAASPSATAAWPSSTSPRAARSR